MPEASPKEYKLYSMTYMILATFVAPAGCLVMSAVILYAGTVKPSPEGPPVWLAAAPAVIGALMFWQLARIPRRIIRHADGRIEFESLIRRVTLSPREILSIKPDRRQFGFLILKHESGKLRLLNQFTGFHELLTYLESVNPAIELQGC